MKGSLRRKSGRSGLELIEEATHILRTAPMATLLVYYVGTIPFVLGFLYFWADMSRNPFASRHLAEGALGVAVLFIWMKYWQSVFARLVRARLAAESKPAWNLRQHLRVLLVQAIIQPSALLLLPLSIIPLGLPTPWTFAFYQNVIALADPDSSDISVSIKKAWKQASLWPLQNHVILGLTAIFAGCVFLNCCTIALVIPGLLKMLFGIESIFTQSPVSMFNTTFFTAMFGLTYLCIDPILKVIYALRCFYGESLQSGEDIKSDLKRFGVAPQKTGGALVLLIALVCVPHLQAQESSDTAPSAAVQGIPNIPPAELDRQISEVIKERKYAWRMPREKTVSDEEAGVITKFFQKIGGMIRDTVKSVLEWIDNFFRRLFNRKGSGSGGDDLGFGWITALQILIFSLVAVLLAVLAIFLMRTWRARKSSVTAVASAEIQSPPDLADENVAADQLPEDGWTRLARELLDRGEYRLAMRAFYLASLAHLAQRNLISIARFKSNRDYANELQRRAHALPELLPVFGNNLSVFERIWYGMHEVNRDLVNDFAANVEKIKTA
jgi:hypothetical protein